jgi:hypothetical protein
VEEPATHGSTAVPADVHALIRIMSQANRFWGAPRIHGEFRNLGWTSVRPPSQMHCSRRQRRRKHGESSLSRVVPVGSKATTRGGFCSGNGRRRRPAVPRWSFSAGTRHSGCRSSKGEPEPQLHHAGLIRDIQVLRRSAIGTAAFQGRVGPVVRVVEQIEDLNHAVDAHTAVDPEMPQDPKIRPVDRPTDKVIAWNDSAVRAQASGETTKSLSSAGCSAGRRRRWLRSGGRSRRNTARLAGSRTEVARGR